MVFTFTLVAAFGTMISPGQVMRYYAARSPADLKKAAIIFALLLTLGYLFGTTLIGLGGKVLFPAIAQPDKIFLVIIKHYLPLGLASLFMVAIMAAAMSTADSNLHALGAMISKDIFKRILHPTASQRQMMLVGHAVIFITTVIALCIVLFVQNLAMLVKIGILSMSFCLQLLPVTVDVLWFRKGRAGGAVAGIAAGILCLWLLFPKSPLTVHYGVWGLFLNAGLFAVISKIITRTRR
jgi:SSS family solute:Na+ symporter